MQMLLVELEKGKNKNWPFEKKKENSKTVLRKGERAFQRAIKPRLTCCNKTKSHKKAKQKVKLWGLVIERGHRDQQTWMQRVNLERRY